MREEEEEDGEWRGTLDPRGQMRWRVGNTKQMEQLALIGTSIEQALILTHLEQSIEQQQAYISRSGSSILPNS
jgi:hypothetical protein